MDDFLLQYSEPGFFSGVEGRFPVVLIDIYVDSVELPIPKVDGA